MMTSRCFLSLALLVQVWTSSLAANSGDNAGGSTLESIPAELRRAVLEDPDTINKALQNLLTEDNPLRKFIDAANIKFKAFDSDKPGTEKSLGFSYDLRRDISRYHISNEIATNDGLTLNLSAKGNVAFDKAANPRDFLDSKIAFLGFFSRGGAIRTTPQVQEKLNELEDAAAESQTREDFLRNPATVEAARVIRANMTTQYYCELAADGGIESDQSFSQKQYTYGGHLGFDIKGWNPDSPWARFNIFDYPFAATRLLLQNDTAWSPRGSALPTVIVGVDQVTPTGNDPRAMVGDESDFPRFKLEAGYRTMAGHINGEAAFFEANVRYYQELGASAAVKAASLDHATVFTAVLLLPKGMYVSYSVGRLPFDVKDSQVYEIGFHYKF
jgi:hypothetical protein